MSTRVRTTCILLLGTWIVLVGQLSVPSLALGLLGCALATFIFGQLFLPGGGSQSLPDLLRRTSLLGCLFPIFLCEAFRSALKLAWMALQPKLSFQPGIVRVPTRLTSQSAITLLANLITLSPGTLTLDFDSEKRCYFIHCIDVRGLDGEAGRRALIARFEEPLRRIFE